MNTPLELELKLGCTPATATQLASHLSTLCQNPPTCREFGNIYYDTPTSTLAQEGIAVRIRTVGGKQWQTVKCAGQVQGGLSSRPEWETPFIGQFDFNVVSDTSLRIHLQALQSELVATLDTRFTRLQWSLQHEKANIALMLDQGTVSAAGKSSPLCELELELLDGKAADLYALAEMLCEVCPLFIAPLSKAARGNRLLGASPAAPRDLPTYFQSFCEALPANAIGTEPSPLTLCRERLAALRPWLHGDAQQTLRAIESREPEDTLFSSKTLGQWLLATSRTLTETEGTCT